jgi:hypothetical protein
MELVLRATLTQFLFDVPLYIVWAIGAIFCLVRWRRHPTVSLLALIAILLFFLLSVIGTLTVFVLPVIWRGSLAPLTTIRTIVQVFGSVIGWMLLLAAVFGWRSEPGKPAVDQK